MLGCRRAKILKSYSSLDLLFSGDDQNPGALCRKPNTPRPSVPKDFSDITMSRITVKLLTRSRHQVPSGMKQEVTQKVPSRHVYQPAQGASHGKSAKATEFNIIKGSILKDQLQHQSLLSSTLSQSFSKHVTDALGLIYLRQNPFGLQIAWPSPLCRAPMGLGVFCGIRRR